MSFNTAWLHGPAIRHQRFVLEDTQVLTESGGIHVHGFLISNNTISDNRVLVREFDGGTILFDVLIKAGCSKNIENPFFVDRGLETEPLGPDAGLSISFFFCGEPIQR